MGQADLDTGREGIVRGLRHVRMIVRADDIIAAFRFADDFQCPVAENFVDVHVYGSTCAALNGVNRELIQEFASNDFISSLHERLADFFRHTARRHIGHYRSLLDLGISLNEVRVNLLSRNLEIRNCTGRLYTVVYFIRNFQFTKEIMLFSHFAPRSFLSNKITQSNISFARFEL